METSSCSSHSSGNGLAKSLRQPTTISTPRVLPLLMLLLPLVMPLLMLLLSPLLMLLMLMLVLRRCR